MIYKLYLRNKPIFVMAVVFISTMIFITAPIVSISSISKVNAADKEGPGYACTHVPGSGTIGQVRCCTSTGEIYCTICDNTTPPSNCSPRELEIRSGDVIDSNEGGVLSQNDDSSGSDDNKPKNLGNNVFNDGGSSSTEGSIDTDKIIEGGGFNQ